MLKICLIDDMRQMHQVHKGSGYHARIARDFEDGIRALEENGQFDVLYLDHDLGEPDPANGYGIMCWLEEHQEKLPKLVKVVSSNPPGRKSIEAVLAKFYEFDYTNRYWTLQEEQYRMKDGE